jgi:hypothetical protein
MVFSETQPVIMLSLSHPTPQVLATHHSIVDAIDLRFSALCGSLLPSMAFRLVKQQNNDSSLSANPPGSAHQQHHAPAAAGSNPHGAQEATASKRQAPSGFDADRRQEQGSAQPLRLLAEAGVSIQYKRLAGGNSANSTIGTSRRGGAGAGREEQGEEEEQGWTDGLEQLSGGQRTMVSITPPWDC